MVAVEEKPAGRFNHAEAGRKWGSVTRAASENRVYSAMPPRLGSVCLIGQSNTAKVRAEFVPNARSTAPVRPTITELAAPLPPAGQANPGNEKRNPVRKASSVFQMEAR